MRRRILRKSKNCAVPEIRNHHSNVGSVVKDNGHDALFYLHIYKHAKTHYGFVMSVCSSFHMFILFGNCYEAQTTSFKLRWMDCRPGGKMTVGRAIGQWKQSFDWGDDGWQANMVYLKLWQERPLWFYKMVRVRKGWMRSGSKERLRGQDGRTASTFISASSHLYAISASSEGKNAWSCLVFGWVYGHKKSRAVFWISVFSNFAKRIHLS